MTNIQQFNKFSTKFSTSKKAINKRSNVKKTSFQHFQHHYYYYCNKLIYKESEVSTGTR
nr:MAG TPA: hypothetical protein [Microviridae sp.]